MRMISAAAFTALLLLGRAPHAEDAPKADQKKLEKEFQETLTNAVLVGSFTVDGKNTPPTTERYTITKVAKVLGDRWLVTARIQYGKFDASLPVPVTVKWAGDTPTIQMTDSALPGLGTFTTRVMIFRDRYAGTWQHGAVGGCMFGRIEKVSADKPAKGTKKQP